MLTHLGRILVITGALLALMGLVCLAGDKIPFIGKLPGDFTIKGKNFTIFFPLATMVVLSVIISVILNLFGRK